LKGCQFFNRALKWSLPYLSKELTDEYGVSVSNSRKFLYYDSTVDYQNYEKAGWRPPYRIQYNSLEEFLEIASELSSVNNGTHAYFQVYKNCINSVSLVRFPPVATLPYWTSGENSLELIAV
jgi:hypothetical protein